MAYLNERLQEVSDQQPMTVYCLHCPRWKATGAAAVVRAASEAHRAKKHPEISVSKKVRSRRAFSSAMTAEREAQIDEERRQRMRALGIE